MTQPSDPKSAKPRCAEAAGDAAPDVDALILGGGLAGLTLALQLRKRFPELGIRVIERRTHPVPEAAHKVGESTVEIGAHYLAETLGLREHLESAHIRKFGFRFFFSEGGEDLAAVTELGVRRAFNVPSYQIDRGIFENFLGDEVRRRGIEFIHSATVGGFDIGANTQAHRIRYRDRTGEHEVTARWLLDASGRAGLVKRKLGLARDNAHQANAVWFRIDDRLKLDDWCADPVWGQQCEPRERWRSTNHMVGPGYWVWLIPLSSGAHSVGIVADAAMHPLERMKTFELALDWLREFQPLVARHVESRRDKLLDFAFFRNFSYDCGQVFSADRWAMTGESGVFLDPFYSPGSDFIAIANTYICELVALDLNGRSLGPYADIYGQFFDSFYRNTLALYQDQYPLFGNAEVMPLKVLWDYTFYWGVLCVLVFQDRLADIVLLSEMREEMMRLSDLNLRMQVEMREWHQRSSSVNVATLLDQGEIDWFRQLNADLMEPLDDAGVRRRLRENILLLERLARAIRARAGGAAEHAGDLLPLFGHAA